MKNLFLTIGVAASLLATVLPAPAQVPTYAPQTLSLPATIPATVVSNFPASLQQVIPIGKQHDVALEWTFNTSQAGGLTNITMFLQRSVTGVNYDPTNQFLWIVTGSNGANTNCYTTNIASQGYGYFKVVAITNGFAAATLTNLSLSYSIKQSAP